MKFSIITVTLNNKDTVKKAVESVVNQTYADIEHIIVDGYSYDGTLHELAPYKDKIDLIISGKDKGIYYALNRGIKNASGDIIAFLHADDFYADSGIIERIADRFKSEKCDSVYGDLVYVRENGKTLRYWRAGEFERNKIKNGWMPPHPAFFVKKNIYAEHGVFNTKYHVAADYDLMLRFLWKYNISTSYLPEVCVNMRVGGKSNKNLKNIFNKSREDYQIIRKQKVGGIKTLLIKNFSKLSQFVSHY